MGLFVCSLFNDFVAFNERMIVNWRGCGRKWLWPDLRYYPGIFPEGDGRFLCICRFGLLFNSSDPVPVFA